MALDKSSLLKESITTEEVELPARNGSVVVRALTRHELHMCGRDGSNKKLTAEEVEALTLHYAMVEPELDITECREWIKVANSGEIQLVIDKVMEISGFDAEAQKKAYKSVRDES